MKTLIILHFGGTEGDFALIRAELERGGMELPLIHLPDSHDLARAIGGRAVHLLLVEGDMSDGTILQMLQDVRARWPDLPLILISESSSPENELATFQAGATDVILKDHLSKLIPVVRRIIQETLTQRDLEAVRRELSRYAELLDLANDAIVISDAAGAISYWNRGAERMYGWSREEATGRNVHQLLQTGPTEKLALVKRLLRQNQHWEGELHQVRRDGAKIVASTGWTLQGGGADEALLQISIDVTERIRAEKTLRENEERYRRFVNEDLTGNLMMDPDGSVISCNPAYARMFGFESIAEARRTNFLSLLRTKKQATELLARLQPNESVEWRDLEMRHRGGDKVYVAARFIGSFGEDAQLREIKAYLFDDTKRKRLEQHLIHAQKMEGLGTLAGGIAHDFNNILSIILAYTACLEQWKTHPEQMPEAIKVIRDAVERGAGLVQQLLTSARQSDPDLTSVDLNALAHELERMLAATFPKMIALSLHLHPNLPPIKADRSQIHQVLLNLCVNARDAIRDHGTVTLETAVVSDADLRELFSDVEAERYACFRVIDTGAGIPAEVKPHIFEPFYTTKERGKGTGLGLSVVDGVVNNHRGFVQVESEPGKGSSFSIYLPLEETQAGGNGASEKLTWPSQPAHTVLLVEDEEMLRSLGALMLQEDGYRVLTAKDGVDALEVFQQHRDEIGVVVCDLGLPRLGGREVFLRMKELKPEVRAIVASGYLEPAIRADILRAGVLDTVQKPYDFRDLLARVRAIMGESQLHDDNQPQLF